MEDLPHLSRLKQQEEKILQQNEEECTKKSSLLEEYKQLKDKLCTISDTTRQNVMVPQGKVAYFSGDLIHTNEILVLLGENWFAERSAKQASEIVNRRMKVINDQLEGLRKEQANLKSYLQFAESFTNKDDDVKEIKEVLPEDLDDSQTSHRTAHKSLHSSVPRAVTFEKLEESNANCKPEQASMAANPGGASLSNCEPRQASFSHEQLFARLNELEAEELQEEKRENERRWKEIEDGEYRPHITAFDQNHCLDSDDDDDVHDVDDNEIYKETSNIRFKHSSSEACCFDEHCISNRLDALTISSPADIYNRFMGHKLTNQQTKRSSTSQQLRRSASHELPNHEMNISLSDEERRKRKYSDSGIRSPPPLDMQQKAFSKSEKPLKSILKNSSRSNSSENLHPRPILKHSPEHQRSPPEPTNDALGLEERKTILKEKASSAGSVEAVDDWKTILKSGGDRTSDVFEEHKPILKMDSVDVHEEYYRPILKETDSGTITPIEDASDELKSILKVSYDDNVMNDGSNERKTILKSASECDDRPSTPECNEPKPILKHVVSLIDEDKRAAWSHERPTDDPYSSARSILKSKSMVASPDVLRTILKSPESQQEVTRNADRNVSFVDREDVRIIDIMNENVHIRQLVMDEAFSGVVIERDPCLPTDFQIPASSTKPISKFKSLRLKR